MCLVKLCLFTVLVLLIPTVVPCEEKLIVKSIGTDDDGNDFLNFQITWQSGCETNMRQTNFVSSEISDFLDHNDDQNRITKEYWIYNKWGYPITPAAANRINAQWKQCGNLTTSSNLIQKRKSTKYGICYEVTVAAIYLRYSISLVENELNNEVIQPGNNVATIPDSNALANKKYITLYFDLMVTMCQKENDCSVLVAQAINIVYDGSKIKTPNSASKEEKLLTEQVSDLMHLSHSTLGDKKQNHLLNTQISDTFHVNLPILVFEMHSWLMEQKMNSLEALISLCIEEKLESNGNEAYLEIDLILKAISTANNELELNLMELNLYDIISQPVDNSESPLPVKDESQKPIKENEECHENGYGIENQLDIDEYLPLSFMVGLRFERLFYMTTKLMLWATIAMMTFGVFRNHMLII